MLTMTSAAAPLRILPEGLQLQSLEFITCYVPVYQKDGEATGQLTGQRLLTTQVLKLMASGFKRENGL